jgi:3-hydroxyisobutyrate dehydrogenase-like beta-hydroxyacid dehydrogenase
MKLGFIGLGSLGTPLAINLAAAGHDLFVFNRTRSKTKVLADKGATVADSIASLARTCDIIFTIVSDDAAITAVCAGTDGIIEHAAKGTVHVSMSTILPATAAALAAKFEAKGLHYLAAPVFGRPDAAAVKKVAFVISGDKAIREKITPLLKDAGGAGVFAFGDTLTSANTVKLCGNFLIASALEAIGESISLASQSGVSPNEMWDMFSQTLFNTPLYHNYSKLILSRQFDPAAFTTTLGLKDIKLVLQQAQSVDTPMPLASLLRENMEKLVSNGRKDTDWSAVADGGKL